MCTCTVCVWIITDEVRDVLNLLFPNDLTIFDAEVENVSILKISQHVIELNLCSPARVCVYVCAN